MPLIVTSDEGSDNLGTLVKEVYGQVEHIPLPARTTRSGRGYLSQVSLLKQTSHVCGECDNNQPFEDMCDFLYDSDRQVHSALAATVLPTILMVHLRSPLHLTNPNFMGTNLIIIQFMFVLQMCCILRDYV